MYNDEDLDLIENIPDESFSEEDLIEEIASKQLTKEQIKKYLSLPIDEFVKLPIEIKDACMVDELIEEFNNSDEVDKYHQQLFMRMVLKNILHSMIEFLNILVTMETIKVFMVKKDTRTNIINEIFQKTMN